MKNMKIVLNYLRWKNIITLQEIFLKIFYTDFSIFQ